MSVVNDMLRDLEKRKAPERNSFAGEAALKESMIEPQKKGLSVASLTVFVIFILALSAVALWFFQASFVADHQEVAGVEDAAGVEEVTTPITTASTDIAIVENSAIVTLATKTRLTDADKHKDDQTLNADSEEKSKAYSGSEPTIMETPSSSVKAPSETVDDRPATVATKKMNVQNKGSKAQPPVITGEKSTVIAPVKVVATPKVKVSQDSNNDVAISRNQDTTAQDDVNKKQGQNNLSQMNVQLSPEALDEQNSSTAMQLFAQGRRQQAYKILEQFVAQGSVVSISRSTLAQAYLVDRKESELLALLDNTALAHDYRLRAVKARWQISKGDLNMALQTLTSKVPDVRISPDYHALLASTYQKLGSYGLAFEAYSELVQFNDQIADWWAGLGLAADQMKQYRQARMAYLQASQMSGLNPALQQYIQSRLEKLNALK